MRKPDTFPHKLVRIPGLCIAHECGNVVYQKGRVISRYCTRHRAIRQRANDPVAAYYADLRHHAKERGVGCSLTLAEWRVWQAQVGFFDNAAEERAARMSVDRIDPNKGYSLDNIQPLTVAENARKAVAERGRKWVERMEKRYNVRAAEEVPVEPDDSEEALLARI
ncbi:hypothetical protein UFOVP783_91 [uncultured Caudovirales phage]|uniref:Uncharacterized protein n=1 Tax=uncultured Caudovirales phage TaxID=2100421 RepID=A0A6J5NV65_9CAUD|nr:hypothetical protein UFOVP783_91 [uncultured Caudovirales phage]